MISTTNPKGIVGDHWILAPAEVSAKIVQKNLHKYKIVLYMYKHNRNTALYFPIYNNYKKTRTSNLINAILPQCSP